MKITEKEILDHLNFLTEIRPFRNCWNYESLDKAAQYIDDCFKEYGYDTSRQKWTAKNHEYENVLCSYRPDLEKRLVIGAHYDVYAEQPGADDNTSGVVGLLILARLIAENKPDLPYGIDFVSYCLEEPPFFSTVDMGSYIHAKSLKDSNASVVGMICLDMIGFFSDKPGSQTYPFPELEKLFPDTGNYIAVIGLKQDADFTQQVYDQMTDGKRIDVEMLNFKDKEGLAGLSDHRNYWHFGYNAVMINNTAKYRNPNYHEVTDTVDTLDLGKMEAVIASVYDVISTEIKVAESDVKADKPKTEEKPKPAPKPKSTGSSGSNSGGFLARFLKWLSGLFGKK